VKKTDAVDADHLGFVEKANPHMWFLKAAELHDQAVSLNRQRGQSLATFIDYRGAGRKETKDSIDNTVFLLGGFAIENAIKAFIVYENPNFISNGRLSRRLQSHSLTQLRLSSALAPLKGRYAWVLKDFESGLGSWARYPCGLSFDVSTAEALMRDRLWRGYMKLIGAYGDRLQHLLSSGLWKGPHGFEGRWNFQGEFFDRTRIPVAGKA